jgi:ubiquinone/menaquinone biosynthesis C-methylase UbiE
MKKTSKDVSEKEYFNYLMKRTKLSFLTRKLMYTSLLKKVKGKTLDIGCGLGEMLYICKNGVGVDINIYCVEYCRSKGLKCFVGSAEKIPFKEGSFDTMLCFHVLEHLRDANKAIKEIRRVLKIGGELILVVPTECGFRRDKTHIKFWNKENIKELLEKFNFEIESMKYFPFSFKFLRERIFFN